MDAVRGAKVLGSIGALALLVAGGTLALSTQPAGEGPWTSAGAMISPRSGHTATLLPDGKVLTVGGESFQAGHSAELYDPQTNRWSSAGTMATGHRDHTVTLFASGKVLVAGGRPFSAEDRPGAELYDPGTNTWSPAGRMSTARARHTATPLANGKVLVVGGLDFALLTHAVEHFVATAELYDPSANAWSPAAEMATARVGHSATLLGDGRVLVAGGMGCTGLLDSAELYDPVLNRWSSAGPMMVKATGQAATRLLSGLVLVVGGLGIAADPAEEPHGLTSSVIYDPSTESWSPAGRTAALRFSHTATLLGDGKVLVAGSAFHSLPRAELYDPGNGAWLPAAAGGSDRYAHTATLLRGGTVLLAGGHATGPRASAERYRPRAAGAGRAALRITPTTVLGTLAVTAGALAALTMRRRRRTGP